MSGTLSGVRAAVLALLLIACGHSNPAAPPKATTTARVEPAFKFDPNAPVQVESLGVPVRASRAWTTALAPNKRGGWNFITQAFEEKSGTPTEFVVVDLQSGKYTITEGPRGTNANSNFRIKNQLRAPNGRIFFPESGMEMAYYDPADETVKQLGKLINPPGDDHFVHSAVFGPDGKLYGGTESKGLPTVIQIDPDTLAVRTIGKVGKDRIGYSYAYYLAVDPPWIYSAVGENPWELAALNINTGEMRILATRSNDAWIKLDQRPEGIVATLITGQGSPSVHKDYVWCVDGKIVPFEPKYDPARLPFRARNVKPMISALQGAPEIDSATSADTDGVGRVQWRTPGSKGPWNELKYQIKYTSPIPIESLVALPDGSVLGNARDYHGFFRFDPATAKTDAYGAHGPSRGARAVMNGLVYITGYPNSVLYVYDPSKPWTARKQNEKDPSVNPLWLGNFAQSGAHYPELLVPASNGRLYFAGRREREGVGGGVGYYDPANGLFEGHHENLSFLDPRGLLVIDSLQRVVYAGKLRADPSQASPPPADAELVLYDLELNEVERQVVKPGLHNTGRLFRTSQPNVIVGVVRDERLIYRYDITAKKLLGSKPLDGAVTDFTQRAADGTIWLTIDNRLVRFDPETLDDVTVAKDLPPEADNLTWQGNDLYFSSKAELFRIRHIGVK
jgi:hypothetical protein